MILPPPTFERRAPAATFAAAVLLLLASAAVAAGFGRGLYHDGAYHLYRLAEREWFYLVDPARTTTQALRQAPVVLAIKLGDFSLFRLSRIFSAAMLTWPVLLVALCWLVAPARAKAWALFPLFALLVGFCTTAFEAVGEASIAVSYLWLLLFLLLFRTRKPVSRLLFLVLCVPAFQIHEGVCLLMPMMAWVCWLRWRSREGISDSLFLAVVALLLAGILAYQLRWMIWPRMSGEREDALIGMLTFGFLYANGHVNIPVITAVTAVMAMAALLLVRFEAGPRAEVVSRALVAGFIAVAAALTGLAWTADWAFAPASHSLARYDPVFASLVLAPVLVVAVQRSYQPALWSGTPMLVLILALAAAQAATDVAASLRWKAYVADFERRLSATSGLVPWDYAPADTDGRRTAEWTS